jgi:serine/threonine-protein kinase
MPPDAPKGPGGASSAGPTPAKSGSSPVSAASTARSSGPPKAATGLSALTDENLTRTLIRRGLVTEDEIETCRGHQQKLKSSGENRSLLEVMIAAKAITATQAQRLVRDVGKEASKKHEIPGYQIIDRLGKGSMGIVYKAKQTSVDRIVAVKVLLDVLSRNREFVKRFEREAKIAAKLSHPNIVNAIDAGNQNGLFYFVMEFVEGENIKDLLDKGKIYDEAEAVRIILAVAEALNHAHERGLIHRDIKPENVILTKEGNVKLADLGLARLTADEKWAAAEAGMAIGTPYYISPEQVRGATDVDIRSDIYSLGATFYHMVTGRVPFGGDDPTEVMKKHVDKNATFPPPDHLNTRLSSGLGEVVETMMARNRDNRYRTPDDLIIDLKCLLRGERPMLAEQKSENLSALAEGDFAEDEEYAGPVSNVSDAEREEMAAMVNTRMNIIMALAILLGLSIVSNVILLAVK